MIGFCGLDCAKCDAYIATVRNDDILRAKVADAWAKLNNAPITPEHINCMGCCSDGVKTYYCSDMCEIRKCALAKSASSCADCAAYSCDKLNELHKAAPEARKALDALRMR